MLIRSVLESGRGGCRQQNRYDGDRDQDRGKKEQTDAIVATGADHQLANAETPIEKIMKGQHLAGVSFVALSSAALADDVHTGDPAGDESHQRPDHRVHQSGHDQYRCRGQRRHGAEDPPADIVEKLGTNSEPQNMPRK